MQLHNRFKVLIFLASIVVSQFSKSDFFSGSILKKRMPNGRTQKVVLIGDQHDAYNEQQIQDLLTGIKQDSLVLVEDINSKDLEKENFLVRMLTAQLAPWISSHWDAIATLFNAYNMVKDQRKDCKVLNIECREELDIHSLLNSFAHGISVCNGSKELKRHLESQDIIHKGSMNFHDGDELRDTYSKLRWIMHQHYMKLMQYQHAIHRACIEQKNFSLPQDFFEAVLPCATYELDIRILHEISRHKDREHIYVLAGANHTERVAENLANLGYQNIAQLGHKNDKGLKASSLNVKQFLSHLDKDDKQKKETDRQAIFSAMPLTVAPALKYAPAAPSWNYAWRNQKPFSMAAMRTAASAWMRRPLVMPQFKVPRMPFNSMPRALKIGGIAATGLGLALFNRK